MLESRLATGFTDVRIERHVWPDGGPVRLDAECLLAQAVTR